MLTRCCLRFGCVLMLCCSLGNIKRGEADEPYAFEAREFLRKKFIGKKVKRTIDYTRPPPPGQKDGDKSHRPFATVKFEGQNVAEMLVAAGLAAVIKHRAEDARASAYDALCIAEAQYVARPICRVCLLSLFSSFEFSFDSSPFLVLCTPPTPQSDGAEERNAQRIESSSDSQHHRFE